MEGTPRSLVLLVLAAAACGDDDGPGTVPDAIGLDAMVQPSSLVGNGPAGTFQAEVDIVASEEAVVVAFMDQRSSSVVGAVNAGTIRLAVLTEGNLTFDAPFAAGETGNVDQFDPTLAMLPDGRTWIGW